MPRASASDRNCRPDEGAAARERCGPGLPLDNLAVEALAHRHATVAVRDKHLQGYLDELAFRHNRRKTNGVARIWARVIEKLVAHPPRTMRQIIDASRRCPWFASNQAAPA